MTTHSEQDKESLVGAKERYFAHQFAHKAGICIVDRERSKGTYYFDICMCRTDDEAKAMLEALNSFNADKVKGVKGLAEKLTDFVFKCGAEPNSPTTRIQFMGGDYPNEVGQGGLCKESFLRLMQSILSGELSTALLKSKE